MYKPSQAFAWINRLDFTLPITELFSSLHLQFLDYTREIVEHLIIACFIYVVLCIILYLCIVRWKILNFNSRVKNPKRVLIVIAHPDDECMFFGPTVLNLTREKGSMVYLMCLSTGHNYGLGKTRKNELYNSCKVLGINEECLIIQKHTDLPDQQHTKWPTELVSSLILQQIEIYDINTLITFDKHGVSSHSNHCSIYYAIAYLSLQKKIPKDCTVYVLESINLIRKYWFILDIPISFLLSRTRYIVGPNDRSNIYKAMKQHVSQLAWFRRLYLIFSRYLFINTLQEMNLSDIELDLDVDD